MTGGALSKSATERTRTQVDNTSPTFTPDEEATAAQGIEALLAEWSQRDSQRQSALVARPTFRLGERVRWRGL